jgi:hypothetical protein
MMTDGIGKLKTLIILSLAEVEVFKKLLQQDYFCTFFSGFAHFANGFFNVLIYIVCAGHLNNS